MIKVEEKYMARCLQLASYAKGETSPNPMVGAVIVHKDKIIGEGFHHKAGEPHAEVNAIGAVSDQQLLTESTLYVNLEPCSHYGKTPPCAELIIKKGIPRVIVGCLDPFPAVSGQGIKMLREAGVEVVAGVMEKESRELNRCFITMHEKQRPYIILKWAQSQDGFIDHIRTDNSLPPVQFSTPQSRRQVHKLRTEVSAIMVGTNTAILDNPSLTARHWEGKSPVRIAIDKDLRIPTGYHLLDKAIPTLIFTSKQKENVLNTEYITVDFSKNILPLILNELYKRNLDSLLVEGGAFLLQQFIRSEIWDEIRVETAPFLLKTGVKAPDIPLDKTYVSTSNNSIQIYKNSH
jgi:diaminohydroxyphosphoribosylaminopyrimidine deaminase/5-amino-6-(5-phosphoribosylamino)uracil reductase